MNCVDLAENAPFVRYGIICLDPQVGSFSTNNIPVVLDMIANSIVYELLARSKNDLN